MSRARSGTPGHLSQLTAQPGPSLSSIVESNASRLHLPRKSASAVAPPGSGRSPRTTSSGLGRSGIHPEAVAHRGYRSFDLIVSAGPVLRYLSNLEKLTGPADRVYVYSSRLLVSLTAAMSLGSGS